MPEQHEQQQAVIKLLQLTDTHLYGDPGGTLLGMNTRDSFRRCHAQAMHTHPQHDLLLLTGDLVHDETDAAYEWLHETVTNKSHELGILPGNHDNPAMIFKHFAEDAWIHGQCIERGKWQIILLDTHLEGSEAGQLADRQLRFLQHCLTDTTRYTLVCMHHPPVTISSAWLDTMQLQNNQAFWDIIDSYPRVSGILFGHIHQELDRMHKGCRLLSTPSTCIQFKPESTDFTIDMQAPGYRWLELLPDGDIRTAVERLPDIPAGIDLSKRGY
jgi:Icc protein